MAIGGHHNPVPKSDVWLTPPWLLERLGPFDLDPCAAVGQPWPSAKRHFTIHDDGLAQPWAGRVWLNPPYGRRTAFWLRRLAAHGVGTALIFARTETAFFFESVWPQASALLFLAGRLHFHHENGARAAKNSGAPSVLVAYGARDAELLRRSGLDGYLVELR